MLPVADDLKNGLIARVQFEFLIEGGSHGHWIAYLTGNEERDLATLRKVYRSLKNVPWRPWGDKSWAEELKPWKDLP